MDPYDGTVIGNRCDAKWDPIRKSLGHTRRFAERMNLAAMRPSKDLASSGYCLADASADEGSGGSSVAAWQGGRGKVTVLAMNRK